MLFTSQRSQSGVPFASYGREYTVASLRTAMPPSPNTMSVPNTSAATTR